MARIPDGYVPTWLRRLHARSALRQQCQIFERLGIPVHTAADILDPPQQITGEQTFDADNVVAMSTARLK